MSCVRTGVQITTCVGVGRGNNVVRGSTCMTKHQAKVMWDVLEVSHSGERELEVPTMLVCVCIFARFLASWDHNVEKAAIIRGDLKRIWPHPAHMSIRVSRS